MNALEIIKQNAEDLIGEEALVERLKTGKPLKVKFGVDPTRADLTFGHMVVFNKLRQFQDLGHEAILIIGDYTATVGDPSGKSALRPVLTREEVAHNAKTYLDQAFTIIDKEKTTVRYNSEWFDKMSFGDALALARKMTVARMLERDDFSKRYKDNVSISIVEFMYPLLQGYDSTVIESDVELGGTDQLFNLLVGRALQKDAGQKEQIVVTTPLLVGLDGVKKMSKSLDNYIAFSDSPKEMFGKIMSVSDEAMWPYYKLLLCEDEKKVNERKEQHPMAMKKELAVTLVGKFYSKEEGAKQLQQFEQVFSKKELPDDMPEFTWEELGGDDSAEAFVELLRATKLFSSKKEIRRLIEQGAIRIDGEKIEDTTLSLFKPLKETVVQSGKRLFFKIK